MSINNEETLGTLRSRLAARVGRSAQGAAASINQALLNDFLRDAQETLYSTFTFKHLRSTWEFTIGAAQLKVDYPDSASIVTGQGPSWADCDPEQIEAVKVQVNSTFWQPLEEGIYAEHDTIVTTTTFPRRYERLQQLEVWPTTDQVYTMRIDGYPYLRAFSVDGDFCTLDSNLVLNCAIRDAKLHYNQKDAQVYVAKCERLMKNLRKRVHGNIRYVPGKRRVIRTRPVLSL